MTTLEIFHAINDGGESAAARTFIVEHQLAERVRFRNVAFEEVRTELKARGGSGRTPALWDGARLHEGREAVLVALAAIV
jgi:hypothetical protein